MTYNLLNYPGTDTTTRNPYFRTIIADSQPDILVVQEVTSQSGVNGFLNNVLNSASSGYAAGLFVDGVDTDNAIFYNTSLFTFLSNIPIKTALRDINEFRLKYNFTGDTLIIYSVHLKASTGSDNEIKRAAEVDSLRKRTGILHSGSYFVIVGDFNIYRSSESSFQKLLDQSTEGFVVDPLNMIGTWNNSVFAIYHTQSPRTRQFGGGANGGMDDRFDMILPSQSIYNSGGISLVPGSTLSYGNDGLHYNDSINRPPNNAVGQIVADALHYASDHLPVIASFLFDAPVPVELIAFTGISIGNRVKLNWSTATEINNYGFKIERTTSPQFPPSKGGDDEVGGGWTKIGFVYGNGNSNSPKNYSFTDESVSQRSYSYRLKQIDTDGTFEYSKAIDVDLGAVKNYELTQNYPNPFNPTTNIDFMLMERTNITLKIFNVLGEEIRTLVNEEKIAGYYSIIFDGNNLPSGVYFYQLKAGNFVQTQKMILLK